MYLKEGIFVRDYGTLDKIITTCQAQGLPCPIPLKTDIVYIQLLSREFLANYDLSALTATPYHLSVAFHAQDESWKYLINRQVLRGLIKQHPEKISKQDRLAYIPQADFGEYGLGLYFESERDFQLVAKTLDFEQIAALTQQTEYAVIATKVQELARTCGYPSINVPLLATAILKKRYRWERNFGKQFAVFFKKYLKKQGFVIETDYYYE